VSAVLEEYDEDEAFLREEVEDKAPWLMKKLKPKHLEIASLLAQGFKNVQIAAMTGVTPQYITMLLKQPLMIQEISRISAIAGTRMEALFEQSVDCIANVMQNGKHGDQLKAVRLQLEATKRIGRPDPMANNNEDTTGRLERLAERLVALQSNARLRAGNETAEEVPYKEIWVERPVLEGSCTKQN